MPVGQRNSVHEQTTLTIVQAQAGAPQADSTDVRMRPGQVDGKVRDAVGIHSEQESLTIGRLGRAYLHQPPVHHGSSAVGDHQDPGSFIGPGFGQPAVIPSAVARSVDYVAGESQRLA